MSPDLLAPGTSTWRDAMDRMGRLLRPGDVACPFINREWRVQFLPFGSYLEDEDWDCLMRSWLSVDAPPIDAVTSVSAPPMPVARFDGALQGWIELRGEHDFAVFDVMLVGRSEAWAIYFSNDDFGWAGGESRFIAAVVGALGGSDLLRQRCVDHVRRCWQEPSALQREILRVAGLQDAV